MSGLVVKEKTCNQEVVGSNPGAVYCTSIRSKATSFYIKENK